MQIWAETGKSALPIRNYSHILYQFLMFTQNLKRSLIGVFYILVTPNHPKFFGIDLFIEYRAAQFAYYIFASAVLVSVGEIILGIFVEKYCQIEWWNYSSLP